MTNLYGESTYDGGDEVPVKVTFVKGDIDPVPPPDTLNLIFKMRYPIRFKHETEPPDRAVETGDVQLPVAVDEPAITITIDNATDPESKPEVMANRTGYTPPRRPLHIMGIGPWSNHFEWHGAPNYGIARSHRSSVPALGLPVATSKSFTWRLGDAAEARTEHTLARGKTVFIEQNATDLWWRRRDPKRNTLDPIGRFNATTVDMSSGTDNAISLSASYTDYQGLISDRLTLRYKDHIEEIKDDAGHITTAEAWETQWPINTPVTEILRWVLPPNAGVDLSQVAAGSGLDLGDTLAGFDIPLGESIKDTLANLVAISPGDDWEWWVEMPAIDYDRPKIRFGTRGRDTGIVLFDVGGPSPITTWSIQRAGDSGYVNELFMQGSDGGYVYQLLEPVEKYGIHDGTESRNIDGTRHVLLQKYAQKRLTALADRTPSYTLTLRPGFWEGPTHINVGDWITIYIKAGADVLTGKYRITELSVDIDTSDTETVSLSLGTPRPSKDPRSRNAVIPRLVRKLDEYKGNTGDNDVEIIKL